MVIRPFTIDIPQADLDDLQRRLDLTRWPDQMDGAGWDYGTNPEYLRTLTDYWRDGFDWRGQERRLNAFPQFTSTIDGVDIHLIHQRGTGPNPIPLLLLHGWPSTFVQMLDILPLLIDPAAHGGDPADSFDVVAASLPGYGFSSSPTDRPMTLARIGELFHRLMTDELGYGRYGIRASDIAGGVQSQMALAHPDAIIGIHRSDSLVPFVPDDLSESERTYIDATETWKETEGAYAHQHRTKPQTLAYGLNDSPVGVAAWILEKFRAWSDSGGDAERHFTRDELLTNIAIYWFTQTINSSIRLYRDGLGADTRTGIPDVPTAHLMGHEQIPNAPQDWARRFHRVDRWTELDHGGHFVEWEVPELVAEDLRAFFCPLRQAP
jgi:pimeloyl-ACP methyl ester carboxylesterase